MRTIPGPVHVNINPVAQYQVLDLRIAKAIHQRLLAVSVIYRV